MSVKCVQIKRHFEDPLTILKIYAKSNVFEKLIFVMSLACYMYAKLGCMKVIISMQIMFYEFQH
jgi:hypothetical protein